MSDLIPADAKVPAHLAKRINQPSVLAESIAGGIATGEAIPKISIKSSRFRIVEGGDEILLKELELETIIVGANPKISKIFYKSSWSADTDPEAPDCFSLNGVTPDISVQNPENPDCATCPNSQWGSRIVDGKELKACSDKKRLAVVAKQDPEGTVYLLEVTPAALRNLNAYQKELSTRGIPVELVTTVVSFDPDASFPKLQFHFGGFLDEDEVEIVEALHGTDEVLRVTGQLESPTSLPEPIQEEEDEEEEEVQGFGAKKEKAPAKKPKKKEPEPEEEEEEAQGFGAKKEKAPAKKEKAPAKNPKKKAAPKPKEEPADDADDDDAQSLVGEIEDLLGDDFDA
jgi:hypothetical protein